MKKITLGIACRGNEFFLEPLIKHWRENGWEIVRSLDADVVWVEWANEQSLLASEKAPRKNVIVRLHESEWYQQLWKSWGDKVALLIHTNPVHSIPNIPNIHIPQPINTDFWIEEKRISSNTLVMVGTFNYKKNHVGMLRILAEDPKRFNVLFVGSVKPEGSRWIDAQKLIMQSEWFAKEKDIHLQIQDYLPSEKLKHIYNSVEFVVSNSINESCHMTIAEAMSCGTKVLIAGWMGAKNNWPEDLIFYTSKEFWEKVDEYPWSSTMLRTWAIERFSQERLFPKIDECILRIANAL